MGPETEGRKGGKEGRSRETLNAEGKRERKVYVEGEKKKKEGESGKKQTVRYSYRGGKKSPNSKGLSNLLQNKKSKNPVGSTSVCRGKKNGAA